MLTTTLLDSFWSRVHKTDSCWNWTAGKSGEGYGRFGAGRRYGLSEYAHRISWAIHFGIIPDNLHVLHRCDNPSCVNPKHLFLGTHQDNMLDRDTKGRNAHLSGEKAGNSKLTEAQVLGILTDNRSRKVIAKEYGISRMQVSNIVNRKSWRHICQPSS